MEHDTVDLVISMNAMNGLPSFKTMRITSYVSKKPLHVLIDSGSTHNFLLMKRSCWQWYL